MKRILVTIACFGFLALAARVSCAGVVVLQNWTTAKIDYVLRQSDGRLSRQSIAPTDIASIPATGPIVITLGEESKARSFTLGVNSIHYFGAHDGVPELIHLKLPGVEEKTEAAAQPPGQGPLAVPPAHQGPAGGGIPPKGGTTSAVPADAVEKIPVAVLIDSDDPLVQAAWEKRVRKRMDEANDIFEHHCRVRFEIVTVGHWASDPSIQSFDQSLMEFAQKVRPAPARLAIGFTRHYEWLRGEMHLGGTHGALASHVLIRESPGQVSEPERLEVLVHELGHVLGAAHTSDQSSVMRPVLGDKRSAAKSFRIGFDAPNTLIMSLFAEELRTRQIWHPSMLSPERKSAVRGAYMVLAQTLPKDPTSTSSVESLGPPPQAAVGGVSPELINGARHVVQAVVQAARENQQLPVHAKDPHAAVWRTDDELTTFYVRRAAAAAQQLPPQIAPSAFLLGLGVALDDSNFVHDKPALNDIWARIEPDDQRPARLLILGAPTMLKRHTVTGHFAMSAALVVLSGPQGAEAAGLGNEIQESRGGDGFSFADLCSDMAGVMFATHVHEGNLPLADIAARFQVEDYVPKLDDLPDVLSWDAFVKQYGKAGSDDFQRQRAELYHRILALPPYRPAEKKK